MFVKHTNLMLNLSRLHVKLEDEYLKFFERFSANPVYVVRFKDKKTAGFAYGRIIHAVLLHWGAVDITEHAITDLMEKKLGITNPDAITESSDDDDE